MYYIVINERYRLPRKLTENEGEYRVETKYQEI